ncbi:low affinity vacuolar monovalent cation/H(+) antiporter-like isoform X1 [Amblyraja radiata]|uniref:low affinity vacuolar monovalent cation/H(+) antiporter-like isoform X1 n=1 Tax=Amblyraja radiata TaxID=386614 RepID=UPI0014029402|nr:low affinity vacuolar monovalent cation/H(+) antiporter-like isoform X1 [Amblyraja radiata]
MSEIEQEPELAVRRRSTQDVLNFGRESELRAAAPPYPLTLWQCELYPQTELMDMPSPLTPKSSAVSCSTMTQNHSCEGITCPGCLMMTKTMLLAENEVEAHKLANNYKFGFKKWKSHVTERPWEDRSAIVKELYSDLNIIKHPGSLITCDNVLYVLLFGWWIALLYLLIALIMFVTIVGIPYGKLCCSLAGYYFWPFGKVILKLFMNRRKSSVRFYGDSVPETTNVETTALLGDTEKDEHILAETPTTGINYWRCPSTYVWLLLGYPLLAIAHGLASFIAWILVVTIPIAKLNGRAITNILLIPPEQLQIRPFKRMDVPLDGEVLLCCYRAMNFYYYKYTVVGINVFAVNLLPLVVVALVLGYADTENKYASSLVKFVLSILAIIPLSYYIGMAIASISAQSNFAVGAVVNATFGSITELTFYITALIKGSHKGNKSYEEVVKSALTGTLLGCVLFIPGISMVIGGCKHQEQRFNSRSAGISSALLFISVGGVFAPTLFSKAYGNLICQDCTNSTQNDSGAFQCNDCHFSMSNSLFHSHVQPLIHTVCILLPASYVIGLIFSLKTHTHIYDIHISDCHVPGHSHNVVIHWSRWRAVVLLVVTTVCMSACAELVSEHIDPLLSSSAISPYFLGVTVLAMVPELPEIVNGIQFALQNNISLSLEVGSSIAVQVCMLQIPILVLFSAIYPVGFNLLFSDLHLWASIFSVILMNYIFMDGKCDYFQGTVLVVVYLIIMAMYYFAPS